MKDRTIMVSNSSPTPMVAPNWPTDIKSLESMAIMVTAKTIPAVVTTFPELATARMSPVLSPAALSSK